MKARVEGLEQAVERFLEQRRGPAPIGARSFAAQHSEFGRELLDAVEAAELVERAQRSNAPPSEVPFPVRVGPFRTTREIGRGGMGVVLEAVEEPLGRRVALKLLSPELLASPVARARLQREAALAARVEHPGVCTILGASLAEPQPWIAMRYVEGVTLARRIAAARESGGVCIDLSRTKELGAVRAVAECLARVARALEAAHAQGVLHRDVKPSNIVVTPDGDPVLLDFGVAIEHEPNAPHLTRTGETAGTPAYLAPELIAGELARPDERCDVYALGVTLYECLALQPPFRAPTRAALYASILAGAPLPIRRVQAAAPLDLAVIVWTATERDRARRYATAAHLAADLEAFVAGRPIAARPLGSFGRFARWARREPRQALLASALSIAAVTAALAGGTLLASRREVLAGREAQRATEIEAGLFDAFAKYGEMQYDDAEARFERVLALDPVNPEARVGRVLLDIVRGRNERALARLNDAPHTPAYDGLRAMARKESPPPEDAEWLARATSFELFVDGDRFLIEAGRRPESERADWSRHALARFESAVARAPRARGVYHVLWAVAAALAREEGSAREASAALRTLWPDSARAHFQAAFAIGDFDPRTAITILERALELDPEHAPAIVNLGVAHLRLGDNHAARRAHERALEVDPHCVDAHVGLAIALFELGCHEESRASLYRAVVLSPRSLWAWAHLQSFAADADSSVRAAVRVLELDPGQTVYRNSYALALEHLGEHRAACEQFSICVAQAPQEPAYWLSYARTSIAVGELAIAFEALAAAQALGAASAEIDALELRAREASSPRR
jgi:serine/threonine protein kinase/Tfp pilus assembly protein PilF